MKNLLLASAAAAAFTSSLAQAQAPAPAATPEHTLTGNMAIVSDYRFRGISQTFGEGFFVVGPAIQGGIDYSHSSGLYLGTWNSNVSGNQYPNGSSIEMDFYGGWKHAWGDFGLDIGTIYYAYPGGTKLPGTDSSGNSTFTTVKNWEVYVGGSWKFLSLKYYYSFTDYFGLSQDVVTTLCNPAQAQCTATPPNTLQGNGGTEGTQYLVGALNYEVMPKLTLTATAGYTFVANYNALSYFDYKVGVTYDLDGWLLGASIIGTDADKQFWYATNGTGKNREIGTTGLILSIGKTF
jgi:uncharacterized protein (TIGR02001 family)